MTGQVDDGFGAVADAFASNFAERAELGAAFCLYVNGEKKVDIHAGIANQTTGAPWTEDSLQLVYSTTKGAAAICVARLVEAGKVNYDEKVATYWPDFAQNGKENITVGQMMSHQAGVPAVDAELTLDQVLEVSPIVDALAAQAPMWEPGTAHGYHALTYGWLAGEVVRQVDGRTIGAYFAEEVAGPLGLDFWIGLPESEVPRVTKLVASPPPTDPDELALMMQVAGPGTLGFRALFLDGVMMGAIDGDSAFNSPRVYATEMPAANGITNAASLSRMYAATIGEVDGLRLVSEETMLAMSAQQVHAADNCLVAETRFGMGFMLNCDIVPMMSDGSFGHAGAGGSLGYADPDSGVAYGYVMNQMGSGIAGDPRTIALNEAIAASI